METETKTIPEDKLKVLREIAESYANLTAEIGQLTVRNVLLQKELDNNEVIRAQKLTLYEDNLTKENEAHKSLVADFGMGSIDIETGIFTATK